MNSLETVDQSILDQSLLVQRCLGDRALALKLTNALMARLPAERKAISDAVHAQDWSLAAQLAHRLKGTAANLAAEPLAAAASRLEIEARSVEPTRCVELLEQLELRIHQVIDVLRDLGPTP